MHKIVLSAAVMADVPLLQHWDQQAHVIAAVTDDPDAKNAFEGADWEDEIAMQTEHYRYLIAELDGRPIGAMQIIDPELEHTHYWGACDPDLRVLDIWIGEETDLGQGYGETMMREAMKLCFVGKDVTKILIDPLASNTRAHKFYQRIGFTPVERRTFGESDCLVHAFTRADWLNAVSLQDLEQDDWGERDSGETSLVRKVLRLRRVAIGALTVENLRILVGQGVGLAHLMPVLLPRLAENPLLEGDFCPGDVLSALLRPANRPTLAAHDAALETVCAHALTVLARRPRKLTTELIAKLREEIADYLNS
jgi:aminoglycoside 6'-N-acetyltransferase